MDTPENGNFTIDKRRGNCWVSLVAACIALAGCASDPAPNYFNGQYYMAGDPTCTRMSALSPSRIMCHNSNGVATGYRDALTPEQIQMYQYNQGMQAQQIQQLTQQLNYTGQQFQQSGQQFQQYQQYTPPAVMPIAPPGGDQIRCISAGVYTNCRY